MKRSLLTISTLIAFFLYCLSSCTADKLGIEPQGLQCDQTTITYEGHVRNILITQCNTSGCHDGNVMQPFLDYNSMDQTRRERIYTRACVTKDMPPTGGLLRQQIDTIRCWQEQGYLEN